MTMWTAKIILSLTFFIVIWYSCEEINQIHKVSDFCDQSETQYNLFTLVNQLDNMRYTI